MLYLLKIVNMSGNVRRLVMTCAENKDCFNEYLRLGRPCRSSAILPVLGNGTEWPDSDDPLGINTGRTVLPRLGLTLTGIKLVGNIRLLLL